MFNLVSFAVRSESCFGFRNGSVHYLPVRVRLCIALVVAIVLLVVSFGPRSIVTPATLAAPVEPPSGVSMMDVPNIPAYLGQYDFRGVTCQRTGDSIGSLIISGPQPNTFPKQRVWVTWRVYLYWEVSNNFTFFSSREPGHFIEYGNYYSPARWNLVTFDNLLASGSWWPLYEIWVWDGQAWDMDRYWNEKDCVIPTAQQPVLNADPGVASFVPAR